MRRFSVLLSLALTAFPALPALAGPSHGIAMHGGPKYPADFTHFDYVNPDAPKGGDVRLYDFGTYDNLHGFLLKGESAAGLTYLHDTLTHTSLDEPFSQYGLIAETVETPADRSWVQFVLRAEARFHDGKPITAADVVWTFEALKEKGHPFYRFYYGAVAQAEALDARTVKFTFSEGDNRELPLIVAQMPVLPKHYWKGREFDKTTLDPPLGSGPYKITAVDPGRSLTYERVDDYWARDLPVNKGRYNFDSIRIDYYRDMKVALEAFKSGEYDFRQEYTSKEWATGYDFPALRDGRVTKVEILHERPTGMQAFVYNLRKPLFADPKVRRALAYAYDFESANKQLFHNAYTRTESYFSNSELASRGLPEGEELAILEKYRDQLPPEVFTTEYESPYFGGDAKEARMKLRENLRIATALLQEAGWAVKEGKLVNAAGEPFTFEILLVNPSFERISLPFKKNLERLGIEARVRTVDTTQYKNRMDQFDFDVTVDVFGQSLSPGNEQRDFWSSASADTPGSRNTIGVKNPVVDELVELVISAPDREALVARCRALDRVLLWGHYVIPQWHIRSWRVAYWNKLTRPVADAPYGLDFDAWWMKEAGK